MYPYGPQQNDNEFRLEDSPYFSYYHCLRINTEWTGFPFFSERHYKLHVGILNSQLAGLGVCVVFLGESITVAVPPST